MPETIAKATPWAKQIRELTPTNKLPFPAQDSNYVHSLVSQIRKQFPLRCYKVESSETTTTVTRLEDAAI